MICPKCSCTVFKPFVDGRCCTNCGKLVEDVIIPVIPMPAKPKYNHVKTHSDCFLAVETHMAAIAVWKSDNKTWKQIVPLLAGLSGHTYRDFSIRQNYARIALQQTSPNDVLRGKNRCTVCRKSVSPGSTLCRSHAIVAGKMEHKKARATT